MSSAHLHHSSAHSPTFPSLHLRHSTFSNPSVALPTSQLILQPFRRFTYNTDHSPTLPSLYPHHSSFSNPTFAFPTSQALHLGHLASRSWDTRVHIYTSTAFIGRCIVASPTHGRHYPRRLSGPQNQTGHEGVKKNLQPYNTQDRTRAVQPVAKRLAA